MEAEKPSLYQPRVFRHVAALASSQSRRDLIYGGGVELLGTAPLDDEPSPGGEKREGELPPQEAESAASPRVRTFVEQGRFVTIKAQRQRLAALAHEVQSLQGKVRAKSAQLLERLDDLLDPYWRPEDADTDELVLFASVPTASSAVDWFPVKTLTAEEAKTMCSPPSSWERSAVKPQVSREDVLRAHAAERRRKRRLREASSHAMEELTAPDDPFHEIGGDRSVREMEERLAVAGESTRQAIASLEHNATLALAHSGGGISLAHARELSALRQVTTAHGRKNPRVFHLVPAEVFAANVAEAADREIRKLLDIGKWVD
jgi:hypothetical protein